MDKDIILKTTALTKKYGSITALNEISCTLQEGSVFGLLGPNGSGKTTFLSTILNILQPTSGSYSWQNNTPIQEFKKHIGTLLETPNFYHYLSAVQNLKITQKISGRGNDDSIKEVLKKVNLWHRKDHKFSSFSLGMKQRLAIASALLGNPKVLILDEPTNGLDPDGIAEIRQLITELNKQGTTIILASHLLDEVQKVCTHVVILKRGDIIQQGKIADVLQNDHIIEVQAADMAKLERVVEQIGDIKNIAKHNNFLRITFNNNQVTSEQINTICFEHGIVLSHLQILKKSLEEVFLDVIHNHK